MERNLLNRSTKYLKTVLFFLFLTSCSENVIENNIDLKTSPIFDFYFENTDIDSVFSKINLPGSIDFISDKHEDFNGSIIFKKIIDIRDIDKNYNFIIEGGIDDYDATYLNGHLIGTSLLYNSPRKYFISKDILKQGDNTLEIKFHDVSGYGGFKGRMYIRSEVGEIISISGTWDYKIIDFKSANDNLFSNNANISINPIMWDLNLKRSLYSSSEYDDFFWESVNTPIYIKNLYNTETDLNGIFWFRKNVFINDIDKDYMISIPKGIDDSDEIYFNGSLVGGANCYNCPRNYTIKKELLEKGKNIISILLSDTNADGGILSPILLNSGDESTSISDGWKYKQIYHMQNISILTVSNQNVFENEEFLYFLPNGVKIDVNNIISKSLTNDNFSITSIFLILLLLIIITLGVINYKLLKKRKENFSIKNTSKEKEDYVFVRSDRLNIKLLKVDILYISAEKDYVKLVTPKKNYLVRKNLKTFNKDTLDDSFIRISRSVIVNIDKITLVDRNMVYLSDLRFKIGLKYFVSLNKLMKK
tara:strand:+ start:346 stop:1944 length:1599 start_codon:yes stop_codon:yes gene_type:complete